MEGDQEGRGPIWGRGDRREGPRVEAEREGEQEKGGRGQERDGWEGNEITHTTYQKQH